jgi:PAS domain S-box-containing protein
MSRVPRQGPVPERPPLADQLSTRDCLLYRYRLYPSLRLEYISEGIVALLGHPMETYDDPYVCSRLVHPDDQHLVDLLLSGNAPSDHPLTLRLRCFDGADVWTEIHSAYTHDNAGRAVEIQGVIRDVTEHKRAEQRLLVQYSVTQILAESETLLDAAPELLQTLGETLDWDRAVLWDLNASGVLLRYVAGWQPAGEDPSGLLMASSQMTTEPGEGLVGRAWAAGEPIWVIDVREYPHFRRPQAAEREGIAAAVAIPIRLRDRVLGVIELFSRDLRHRDDDLVRLMMSLGSQIGQFIERRRAERERKQLERQFYESQKMEAIGHLAGGVAHDFNNLLTAILGYCQLLLDGLRGSDPLRGDVQEIERAADAAGTLTRQLLTFSRRELIEADVVDFNTIVSRVEKLLRRLIGEHIVIDLRLAPSIRPVLADGGQIEQVILNLAVNARDAMPTGGTLVIETGSWVIDEEVARGHIGLQPGSYVSLVMRDTGCGMPPEVQARVFEPFFTTKERGKGTGLGLATVYGIVKQCHGHIWVMSDVGKGSTFTILLPATDHVASAPVPVAVHVPHHESGETILLVEDDDAIRDITCRVLERQGYYVIAAESGPAALDAAAAHGGDIDLLFSDVVMPGGMTGDVLAEEISRLRPGVKLLYTSGYADEAIARRGMFEGVFLEKPFTPTALLKKVREALDS